MTDFKHYNYSGHSWRPIFRYLVVRMLWRDGKGKMRHFHSLPHFWVLTALNVKCNHQLSAAFCGIFGFFSIEISLEMIIFLQQRSCTCTKHLLNEFQRLKCQKLSAYSNNKNNGIFKCRFLTAINMFGIPTHANNRLLTYVIPLLVMKT